MTIHERAARIYCEQKGIDPKESRWSNDMMVSNVTFFTEMFEDLELKLYCLRQAEDTK